MKVKPPLIVNLTDLSSKLPLLHTSSIELVLPNPGSEKILQIIKSVNITKNISLTRFVVKNKIKIRSIL